MDEVEYLQSLQFTWTKIAQIVGIRRRTLYRRLSEWNLPLDPYYSTISDSDLDSLVAQVKSENHTWGEILLMSHLHTLGIRIQRSRLRGSLHKVDHIAIEQRQRDTIQRCVYSVEAPNSLWHIDRNHKLISEWRYRQQNQNNSVLHCASNNLAATVLHHFQCAVNQCGLPDCARTDRGGENVDVWRFMIQMHETSSSVIAGSSTYNVRIEHLWRDTFPCVISHYYELFYSLEEQQLLNPLNETDMYCHHYNFIPRINKHLHDFTESWNHHALSTEHNQTPYQLMLLGLIDNPPQSVTSSLSSGSQPLPQHLGINQHVQVPQLKYVLFSDVSGYPEFQSSPRNI